MARWRKTLLLFSATIALVKSQTLPEETNVPETPPAQPSPEGTAEEGGEDNEQLYPPFMMGPGVPMPPGAVPPQFQQPPPPDVPLVLYDDNWESLDERPLPDWYEAGKIGVMVHLGIYSVIGVGSEWFWWSWQGERKAPYVKYVQENFKPSSTYSSFTKGLTASFYNPAKWAELFEHAGARYAIISAKHHDGYCMWPSPYSQHWNSMDSGPERDVVGEFILGVRQNSGMKAGVSYSLFEWFNPLYLMDKANNFSTAFYPATKSIPELRDLVERYTPDILWTNGDWEAPDTYWNSTAFLKWLYNESPVRSRVVVNDRWGLGTKCKHGGVLTCGDNYNPRQVQSRKFETARPTDKFSWGHRRNAHVWDILKPKDIIKLLVETVSSGGNLLLNVGATADGLINPIYEDRLLEMGKWLDVNGEGIYATTTWTRANDTLAPNVWYTKRKGLQEEDPGLLYAIVLKYPVGSLVLASPKPTQATQVFLFGFGELQWKPNPDGHLEIEIPPLQKVAGPPHGWVFRLSRLDNH